MPVLANTKGSMKTVVLSSKSSHQDLLTYGPELFETLKKTANTVTYDHIEPDFSNIPELFDQDEKLVLFNHFALPDGFSAFTQFLPTFKNVKFVLSPYSAYEGLDLELLKKMGIRYRNNGGANAKSVAQYAIMAMFMLLSKFPVLTREMKMPDGSILGEEYHQKTAGIIGMGNVGRELLKTLTDLHIPTVFYNRSSLNVGVEQVPLSAVFNQDLIFITVATNNDTKALLKDLPTMLQPQNYLIDISAADDLYDKKKVVELLDKDLIKGYALEIFELAESSLSSQKNLLTTPHIAWCTIDAERRTVQNFLNRALTILNGKADGVDFIV